MHPRLCAFRPVVEILEDRCTPSGVTGSFAHGVWTLTGDGASYDITVNSAGTPGSFAVTGNNTTVTGVTNPTGVKAIVYDLGAGNDKVTMNTNAQPIRLKALTFLGGDGDNALIANHLTVNTNLRVTNGTGFDATLLTDFRVKGNVFINDNDGGSSTRFETDSSSFGFNSIRGNLTILNGAGADNVDVADTNVGGNIINSNGAGGGGLAGYFNLYNVFQTAARAVIGGNVKVTFVDGDTPVGNGIWDTRVRGNVTFNNGSGASKTSFDGYVTTVPVKIDHNLTITGSGSNKVSVGLQYSKTGMIVGGNLLIDLGKPANPLEAFHLVVHGTTTIE